VRLRLLGCLLIVVFAMGITGCDIALGGSKSTPSGPLPTSIEIITQTKGTCTTKTPCPMVKGQPAPLLLEALATFSDGATQNDTIVVTWTSSSKSIVTVADSTTTPGFEALTAVGVGTATITVTTTNALTATAVISVGGPTLSTVTITPFSASIAPPQTWQYTATAGFSDGSTQNVTSSTAWTSSATGFATINATTGLATAVASGQTTITGTYQSVSGSTVLNVVPTLGYTNASLKGPYAFALTNTGTNSAKASVPQYFVGSFNFDGNGNITGVIDANAGATIVKTGGAIKGTYFVWADGRGYIDSLTCTNCASGAVLPSSSYRFVLSTNTVYSSPALEGQFIQFDGKGSAAGTFIQQTASAFTNAALNGTEVFRFTGVDTLSPPAPLGKVGYFIAAGNGTISSGADSVNDEGAASTETLAASAYTAPSSSNGRGTLSLSIGGISYNYVYYVVQTGNVILLSTDTGAPVLLGHAEQQTGGPFTNASLGSFGCPTFPTDACYAYLLERPPATGRGTFHTVGRVRFDGLGNIEGGTQDEITTGTDTQIDNGTYSVSANGFVAVTQNMSDTTILNYTYYLISASRAYLLETNDGFAAVGTVDLQTPSFANTTLTGNYAFGAADLSVNNGTSALLWLNSAGTGNLLGVGDVSSGGSLVSVIFNATYNLSGSTSGRIAVDPITQVGAASYTFYVVTSNETYVLGTTLDLNDLDGSMFLQ
jgi:hypothetical protein